MRSILVLSVALLGLTLLLNFASTVKPRARTSDFSIIAVSKGRLLPAARLGGTGPETLAEGILAGELSLHTSFSEPGLRVAIFRPGFRFRKHRNYDLASSAESVDDFLDSVPRKLEGSLVVMAGFGNIRPTTPETQARLEELEERLAGMGAEARPLGVSGASWAMISVVRPGGWVKLAESYSEELGVTASFVVSGDLTRYDDFRGDLSITRAVTPVEVALDLELASTNESTANVKRDRWANVGGVRKPSIMMNPIHDAGSTPALALARWDDVALGRNPRFTGELGLASGTQAARGRLVFRVLIDDAVAAEHVLIGPMPQSWQAFDVDLGAYSQQRVSIELQVEEDSEARACVPLWGLPMLRYSAAR